MPDDKQLARFGFWFERGGTHSSRTMMLVELTALLDYVNRADATKTDYLHAVEQDNCLGKRSGKTRRLTYRHLAELYSFDTAHVLFRALLYFSEVWPSVCWRNCGKMAWPTLRAKGELHAGFREGIDAVIGSRSNYWANKAYNWLAR